MWRFVFPKFGKFFQEKKRILQKNIRLKINSRNLLEFHTKKRGKVLNPGS
jgi:hypothetical protein